MYMTKAHMLPYAHEHVDNKIETSLTLIQASLSLRLKERGVSFQLFTVVT